jgi:ankyrin repeat protein
MQQVLGNSSGISGNYPASPNSVGQKSVLEMIESGDVNTIQLFQVNGWDIDSVMDCGTYTPLIFAISCAQKAVCRYLLDHGASLKVTGCSEHEAKASPGSSFLPKTRGNYSPSSNTLKSTLSEVASYN